MKWFLETWYINSEVTEEKLPEKSPRMQQMGLWKDKFSEGGKIMTLIQI